MPIDIRLEPLAIAVIRIVGCTYVGHLAIYARCLNMVIVLRSVTSIATILFYGIFAITSLQRHR
jgi:hypothetical protein